MGVIKTILIVLQVIAALAVVLVVLFQSGKNAGLSGAIAGAADSFLGKGKAKTTDAMLAKATKWVAAVFMVLTLVIVLM